MPKRPPSAAPIIPGLSYLRPLGSGGFADVFLFEQDLPRRDVAVKVLLADAIDPGVRRRFAREADVMARLSTHPSILSIHQASIAADGRPYLVTEYCPGSMAAEYRRQPLPVAQVLDTGVRIAGALETAHRAGVLHRDIKPSNILITAIGAPVLADFGIAAALGGDGADGDELLAMSIPWSSPEVLDEQTSGTVASEVWSLGATLYTLLAGRSPFVDPDRTRNECDRLVARIRRAKPSPIERDDVPPAVRGVLERTMQREPAKRHGSMLELAEELRWAQVQLGLPPTPVEGAVVDTAGTGWGVAPAPAEDAGDRGPVLPTVQDDSRRAARAAAAVRAESPARSAAAPRRGPSRGLVIGLIVAGAVVVLAAAAVAAVLWLGML